MGDLTTVLQEESAALRWQTLSRVHNTSDEEVLSDRTTLSALMQALADEHPFVRWQAGQMLASQMGGRQQLIELLKSELTRPTEATETMARQKLSYSAAIDALVGQEGSDITSILINTLQMEEALLRQSAAEALAKQRNLEAVPHLIKVLNDSDPWVRRAAVYALANLEVKDAAVAIGERLKDESVIVRRSAAYALGALRAKALLSRLQVSLTDKDAQVRRNAAWALGRLGFKDAVPALKSLLDDPALDGTVALTAHQAIQAITKPHWLRLLFGAQGHTQ